MNLQSYNDKTPPKVIDLSRFEAINQVKASHAVSDKYKFIPTTRALSVLAEYGWFPVEAREARTRKEEHRGYQKHALRLANEEFNRELSVGSTIPHILLTN